MRKQFYSNKLKETLIQYILPPPTPFDSELNVQTFKSST